MKKFTDEEIRVIVETCEKKELIGEWQKIADVLNNRFNTSYSESCFRKPYQAYIRFKNACKNVDPDYTGDSESIQQQRRNLEKERKKLQTEKIEYNRWLREDSRDELILEKITNAIENLEPIPTPKCIVRKHNKEFILVFGDEHFGAEFEIRGLMGEIVNAYSPEIFYQRMERLKNKVIEIIQKENITMLHIFNMGDGIDGLLRTSQLMKLRYGVVESTIKYAEYISNWLNEITKYTNVEFQMTNGNHSELRMLGQPKGSFTDDNMGKIVGFYIQERLRNNLNFVMIENPTGYIFKEICGYNIVGFHGETRSMENTLKNFSKIYKIDINYLIAGHMHHSKTEEIGMDCEIINIPSIIGVDPYGLSIEKVSKSSARLLVFEENMGKTCEYTIKLN